MEKIVEDAMSRFAQICDYKSKVGLNEATFLGNTLTSEDDNGANTEPTEGGGTDNTNAMGGDPNAMGGAPAPDGNTGVGAPMGDDPNAMGGAPAPDGGMGGAPTDGASSGPEGFDPQVDMSGAPEDLGGEQPGDEVVDITDLTDSQEDTQKEVEGLNGKFDKVLKALGAFEELIKSNDEKIDSLQAEFERRNPTQVEKLSMQTDKSYPFNVTPEEYWKEKTANSNYSTEPDDNGKEQGQYVITKDDVNNDVNWNGIAKSLDDEDWMFGQTLDKVARF